MTKTTSTESAENPFKDNLANSEALPTINKLSVKIEENYLSKYENEEKDELESKNNHIEMQKKRR